MNVVVGKVGDDLTKDDDVTERHSVAREVITVYCDFLVGGRLATWKQMKVVWKHEVKKLKAKTKNES